jgi:putative flavoprotein involved in K+ transport
MADSVDTLIIGGGQAGLALSYFLTQRGFPHLVLEQAAQAANVWRNGRWDSFTFVTPNHLTRLPGTGDGAGGAEFMPREQIIAYFEDYIRENHLPVRYNTRVTSVEAVDGGYRLTTEGETLEAANVVVATGFFQHPKLPAVSQKLPPSILQLHSGQYRNPQSLPPGAVLVVGSGQSGLQIVEDLQLGGRRIYLSVSGVGRMPRRYRGADGMDWLVRTGFFDRTVAMLPSPQARFNPSPHLSGARGGHTINLHQLYRDGIILLGHVQDVQGDTITFAPDLKASLARCDQVEVDLVARIDAWIAANAPDVPPETLPQLKDGYDAPDIPELDLNESGITTIIWATGYRYDYSLVKLPVFDEAGMPVTERGVTAYPGLYFLGMPWLYKMRSGFFLGIGDDAAYLADHIVAKGG